MKTMNPLTRFLQTKTTWTNWQLGIFKCGVGAFWLIAGVLLDDVLEPYLIYIAAVGLAAMAYSSFAWLKQAAVKQPGDHNHSGR
jgi:hypothetical protein